GRGLLASELRRREAKIRQTDRQTDTDRTFQLCRFRPRGSRPLVPFTQTTPGMNRSLRWIRISVLGLHPPSEISPSHQQINRAQSGSIGFNRAQSGSIGLNRVLLISKSYTQHILKVVIIHELELS